VDLSLLATPNSEESKRVTDQVSIDALYSGFNRSISLFGLLAVGAWLFTGFSYYLSRKTGTDWFSRSGSIMGLIGAVTTFRGLNLYQHKLAVALKEGLVSLPKEVELALDPPRSFRVLSYWGYLTGVVGTVIWGYGDLLLHVTLG
jgi:hypothetical protein